MQVSVVSSPSLWYWCPALLVCFLCCRCPTDLNLAWLNQIKQHQQPLQLESSIATYDQEDDQYDALALSKKIVAQVEAAREREKYIAHSIVKGGGLHWHEQVIERARRWGYMLIARRA